MRRRSGLCRERGNWEMSCGGGGRFENRGRKKNEGRSDVTVLFSLVGGCGKFLIWDCEFFFKHV